MSMRLRILTYKTHKTNIKRLPVNTIRIPVTTPSTQLFNTEVILVQVRLKNTLI